MKDRTMNILFMLLVSIMIFIALYCVNQIIIIKKNEITKESINTSCKGMNLFNTSYCLQDQLDLFYKYNISNAGRKLTDEQLKNIGGVCEHFSNWIKQRFIDLGAKERDCNDPGKMEKESSRLYVTQCLMGVDNQTSHKITIASNTEGYCSFSNNHVYCERFAQ